MRITEELRKWKSNIQTYLSPEVVLQLRCELNAIADRIDEECERRQEDLIDETLGGFIKMTDENMAKNGWIRLPKDSDGEYIHIGDVMEGVDKYDSLKNVMGEVVTISFEATLDPDDSMTVGIRVWSDDRKSYHIAYLDPNASVYRHHHEPTVEDVLREFSCLLMGKREFDGDVTEAVAEYAKKLQLREES